MSEDRETGERVDWLIRRWFGNYFKPVLDDQKLHGLVADRDPMPTLTTEQLLQGMLLALISLDTRLTVAIDAFTQYMDGKLKSANEYNALMAKHIRETGQDEAWKSTEETT